MNTSKLHLQTNSLDKIRQIVSKYMLEILLLGIIILLTILSPSFLSLDNGLNILRNMSLQGVIAFGMTLVIIAGEIDLSIGSTVALTGVIIGMTSGSLSKAGIMPMEMGVIVGIIISLVVAGLIGLFNGWILTKFKLPSFIITLAMMNILYGIAAILSKGFPITTFPSWYNYLGAGRLFGIIPVPAVIMMIVFAIAFVVVGYTKFGRSLYAVGGNPEAARLSGINTSKVKIMAMIGVQICAALGGILVSSQVMSGSFSFGKGWEMIAISSVIIGGASLFGGIGKVWGTLIGLIFLGVVINGMTLLNVNEYAQYVVRGTLILGAVLINVIQHKKKDL